MTINPRNWRKARNATVKYANSGASLTYVWREYQDVVAAWQSKRKVNFQALAEFDRAAIIEHLELLK